MRKRQLMMAGLTLASGLFLNGAVMAQQNPLKVQDLGNGIYAILGPGGNIGVSVGEDGVFLIDDKYGRTSEQVIAAVAGITDKPIRFVINTHWHGDHTGANQALSAIGSVIVAHHNVRKRLSTEQFQEIFDRRTPPSPDPALPVITFEQQVSFHLNGGEARVYHTPRAHTDGDSIVYFEKANVLHAGDLYFAGAYPFLDIDSGGGITGELAGLDFALSLINEETQVISGHGGVTTQAEFKAYRDTAKAIHDRLQELIDEGKSLEDILAARITADFDAEWGNGYKRLNDPDSFVTYAYRSLTGKKE